MKAKQGKGLILDAPYIDQSVRYPTGCESVSAVMLLQYLKIPVTVDGFIGQYLDKKGFEERGGELYGPDPRNCFCGSPYDSASFGCYAPVIAKALDRVFQDLDGGRHKAVDETGTPLQELLKRYIDRGMPVICWACIDMKEPVTGPVWRLLDTGEPFTWISNEHCMLLVGYDEERYYFNDPHNGNGLTGYEKGLLEQRWRAQHMQAVGVTKTAV